MKFNFIPTKSQLEQFEKIGFKLPDDINDAVWILEHSGDPMTISAKWIAKSEFDEYQKNAKFLGMSVNETIPAFRI